MKKIFFLAVVGACVLLLSGCGFEGRTIKLGDGYSATSSLSEKGDTLWTVRNQENLEIFTLSGEPRRHITGAAFIANQKEGFWTYYSLSGKELGRLKGFKEVSGDLYTAYSKEGKVLYFKKTEEMVNIKEYRLFNGYLGYQRNDDVFIIQSVNDGSSWTVPEQSFIWVELPSSDEGLSKPKIVVVEKRQAIVYSVTGAEDQKIPIAVWNKKIKGVKMIPFGKAQRCELPKL